MRQDQGCQALHMLATTLVTNVINRQSTAVCTLRFLAAFCGRYVEHNTLVGVVACYLVLFFVEGTHAQK